MCFFFLLLPLRTFARSMDWWSLDVDADVPIFGIGSGCWGDDDESINQRMEVWMEVWMAADSHALVSLADFGVLCSLGWRAAQRPWGGFAC